MNDRRRKVAVTFVGLMALLVSQTGLVAGTCTLATPAGLPMIIVGAASIVLGLSNFHHMDTTMHHDFSDWEIVAYAVLLVGGIVLDDPKPESISALNEIPDTELQRTQMNVSSEDIQAYNDHLNGTEIVRAYHQLKSEAHQAMQDFVVHQNKVGETFQLRSISQIPRERLIEIAKNIGLSLSDAQILLYKTFGTKTY